MKNKKAMEPKTTTYGCELTFHIGESQYDDIPDDIQVGEIVGISYGALNIELATVKSVDPLIVIDTSRQEIRVGNRGDCKLIGRLVAANYPRWLPNRFEYSEGVKNRAIRAIEMALNNRIN